MNKHENQMLNDSTKLNNTDPIMLKWQTREGKHQDELRQERKENQH